MRHSYENLAITKLEELEGKSKELEITWAKFCEELKIQNEDTGETRKPDMNFVRVTIQKAQAQIQKNKDSKLGKAKSFFAMSAQVLDDHHYLFELLPTGDKYTSVFTGAFTAIVKVSYSQYPNGIILIMTTKGDSYA
jgi:hypothetical protein